MVVGVMAWSLGLTGPMVGPGTWGQESSETRVDVVMLDGSVRVGQLQSITGAAGLDSVDGRVVPLDDIRELRTPQRLLGDDPTTITVMLRGQGVLHARSLSVKEGVATIETDLAQLTYALLDIRGIRLPNQEGEAEWQTMLAEPSQEEDRLLVTTSRGPRIVAGLIESIDPAGVQIVFEDASRRVTMDKILAIAPAVLGDSAEPKFQIRLVDRSVLVADDIEYQDQKWTFRRNAHLLSFPSELVVSFRVRSDRVFELSELTPVIDTVQTIIAPDAVNRRDTSVMGSPLTLLMPKEAAIGGGGPRVFAKGWGVRARSRVVFEIPAGFRELRGWVGIDTATNGQGTCQAVVLIDGIQVGSWSLEGSGTAQEISLPVNGGRRLELLVEPGPQLDLSDWVNWADLQLIK
jgi:hypothetical protein